MPAARRASPGLRRASPDLRRASPDLRRASLARAFAALTLALLLAPLVAACAPIVRPPGFVGARDVVTDASLLGPFDGQVVDAATGEPIAEATVVAVWSYDRGDGFIAPHGSETISVQTDEAGRYRIARAPMHKRGSSLRLVSFHLVVYKRGYASYRSDLLFEGGARRDFTGRHNRIELQKWRDRDSHAQHLLFLAPPREVARVAGWERTQANLDLYEALGGGLIEGEAEPGPGEPGEQPSKEPQWLDATQVIFPEDVAMRTGYDGEFVVEDLGDFPRTDFYHGMLFRALDRDESYDFSVRVWRSPPGGLDPVIDIFRNSLPVEVSPEVTAETWVYEEPGNNFRGVAFIEREANAGVLVSCGPEQCIDVDTAIILAKFIHGRLNRLEQIPAGPTPEQPPETPAATESTTGPTTEEQ